jgi:hypothetical protein
MVRTRVLDSHSVNREIVKGEENKMPWYKSKILWGDVIAILIMVLQYLLNLPSNPASWVAWEGMAVVILNAIAGMIQSQTLFTIKKVYPNWRRDLTLYKNKNNQPK